jgi:hypothetical protein
MNGAATNYLHGMAAIGAQHEPIDFVSHGANASEEHLHWGMDCDCVKTLGQGPAHDVTGPTPRGRALRHPVWDNA